MRHILIIDEDLEVFVLNNKGERIWSQIGNTLDDAITWADGIATSYGLTRNDYIIEAV